MKVFKVTSVKQDVLVPHKCLNGATYEQYATAYLIEDGVYNIIHSRIMESSACEMIANSEMAKNLTLSQVLAFFKK